MAGGGWAGGDASLGTAARLSAEVWTGVLGGGRNGIIAGVFALGVWADTLGDRAVIGAASAGFSIRVPLIAIGK